MSGRVKVKTVKMSLGPDTKDIGELFSGIMNEDKADLSIIYPKYETIKKHSSQIAKTLRVFADSPLMGGGGEDGEGGRDAERKEIEAYLESYEKFNQTMLNFDLEQYVMSFNLVAPEIRDKFAKNYAAIKEHEFINSIILVCDVLDEYSKYFTDRDRLNHGFIIAMPTATWQPLASSKICSTDFKSLAMMDESVTRFVMLLLFNLYESGMAIWKMISTPDIDIERVSMLISESIQGIKKIPAISRCHKAFDKLEKSVGLLKENFGEYYKSVIVTKDPSMLVQEYIIDVSKSSNPDPEVMRQFTTIINYYQKQQQERGGHKNPKVQAAIDSITANFAKINKGTSGKLGEKKNEDEKAFDEEVEKLVDTISAKPRTENEV